MDDVLRAHLHDLTLDARHALVKEARELLQGVYGLSSAGTRSDASTLPAVQALEEARETYAMLERHLQDERSAGLSGAEAMEKLVREVAFTHLNRLVAFKMMESRKLLRGTLDRYHESNAFKFYLAEHPEDLARYDAGTLPQMPWARGHVTPPTGISCWPSARRWRSRSACCSIRTTSPAGCSHVRERWAS